MPFFDTDPKSGMSWKCRMTSDGIPRATVDSSL